MTTPFLHTMQLIEDLLTAEEAAGPVQDLTDLASHRVRRSAIEQALEPLEVSVARLRDRWHSLSTALQGRYILSYNLSFDLDKLRENAERCGVEPVTIIGECLMLKSQHYFHQYSYPKLTDLCRR